MTKQEQITTLINKQGFPVLDMALFLPELEAVIFDGARDISEALNNWRMIRANLNIKFDTTLDDQRQCLMK